MLFITFCNNSMERKNKTTLSLIGKTNYLDIISTLSSLARTYPLGMNNYVDKNLLDEGQLKHICSIYNNKCLFIPSGV